VFLVTFGKQVSAALYTKEIGVRNCINGLFNSTSSKLFTTSQLNLKILSCCKLNLKNLIWGKSLKQNQMKGKSAKDWTGKRKINPNGQFCLVIFLRLYTSCFVGSNFSWPADIFFANHILFMTIEI
jgi:hypothetical protein